MTSRSRSRSPKNYVGPPPDVWNPEDDFPPSPVHSENVFDGTAGPFGDTAVQVMLPTAQQDKDGPPTPNPHFGGTPPLFYRTLGTTSPPPPTPANGAGGGGDSEMVESGLDDSKGVNLSVMSLADRVKEVRALEPVPEEQNQNATQQRPFQKKATNPALRAFLDKRRAYSGPRTMTHIDSPDNSVVTTQPAQISDLARPPDDRDPRPRSPGDDPWYSEESKRERSTRTCSPRGADIHQPRSVYASDFLLPEDAALPPATRAGVCNARRRLELAGKASSYLPSREQHSNACVYRMDHANADKRLHDFFVQRRTELAETELAAYAGNPGVVGQVLTALEKEAEAARKVLERQAQAAERSRSKQQLEQAVQNRARVGQHTPWERNATPGCSNRQQDEDRAERKRAREELARSLSRKREERLRATRPSQTCARTPQQLIATQQASSSSSSVVTFAPTRDNGVFAPDSSGAFRRRVRSPGGKNIVSGGTLR